MIWVKSFLAGVAAALAACIIFVVFLVLPLGASVLMSGTTGSGGVGFVTVDSGPLLAVALVAFAAGFYWKFRRASRPRRESR